MPDQTQLRNDLIVAYADLGAALGGFLGNLFGTDVDTPSKSATKRASTLENLELVTLTEPQEALKATMLTKWDAHDQSFPGGG